MGAEDGTRRDRGRLETPPEAMRATARETVEMLVRRLSDPAAPPLRRATPDDMRARLATGPPAAPVPFGEILARLEHDVLPFASRGDHPGFLAFVPFSGTWPGALGDFIASACNIYAGSWMESAGPTQLELEVLGWFKEWIGYPAESGGLLLGGGSAANMTALACARESLAGAMSGDLVAYVSDQAHCSLGRAARVLGFRPDQLRVLPVGEGFRLRPGVLAAAMDADLAAGRRPLFVSATAGTTNTGAIDPLAELADVCAERGAWLHVDAAYGGFAALSGRGRALLAGIERADSVTLDPHKWLHQPYECGCLLVRSDERLRTAFEMTPDYLHDAGTGEGEVNLCDRGLQLTRSTRALKVWISLHHFGTAAFAGAVDDALDIARRAQAHVERDPALELLTPASLGVVCFRRRWPGAGEDEHDEGNAALVAALEASGLGLISSTRIDGRYALRICVLSHTTRWADVERVLGFLAREEPGPRPGDGRADSERDRPIERAPLPRRLTPADAELGVPVTALRACALFDDLDDADAERVAALARAVRVGAGAPIVAQWDTSLDFFAIVDGRVAVDVDDSPVDDLGPGEFFGEVAALDWGAGFGYARTASVRAEEDTLLLVFAEGTLNELVRDLPAVGRRIRRTLADRLRRDRV